MKTASSFFLCALIKVSNCETSIIIFNQSGGSISFEFTEKHVTTEVRSHVHCAVLCHKYPSCFSFDWDQTNKTCQKFKRNLIPEATSYGQYTNDKAWLKEQSYIFMAGMLVRLVAITGLSWDDAQNYCVNDGGRLIVLDTPEKYHAIKSEPVLQVMLLVSWWVGGTKLNGTWTWTTGQAVDPNMTVVTGSDDYRCLAFLAAAFSHRECTWNSYFICEK